MVDETLTYEADIIRETKELKLAQKIEIVKNDDERLTGEVRAEPTDRQKEKILDALDNIELPKFFTYTGKKPKEVVEYLIWYITVNKVELKPYKPKWRWSKVVGYRNKGEYIIYYNVYKIP